jgi:hypothetical protein
MMLSRFVKRRQFIELFVISSGNVVERARLGRADTQPDTADARTALLLSLQDCGSNDAFHAADSLDLDRSFASTTTVRRQP